MDIANPSERDHYTVILIRRKEKTMAVIKIRKLPGGLVKLSVKKTRHGENKGDRPITVHRDDVAQALGPLVRKVRPESGPSE